MIFLLIIIFLFVVYALMVLYCRSAWLSIPDYVPAEQVQPVQLSVIIPARNEENNIAQLLGALQKQAYPEEYTEVIVVDDDSTDQTAAVTRRFAGVKLLQLNNQQINSYKKKAIDTGIGSAAGDLIVTTDADCHPGKNWLQAIVSLKNEKQAVAIAGPVVFRHNRSLLQVFQALDFMALQGVTAVSVHKNILSMSNGANLAYEKQAFDAVNGFAGVDHIASGDDMLLIHKLRKAFPGRIHYLKSAPAIVETQPMKTWKDFFNQRIRWASKAGKYQDKRITVVLLLIYLFNLAFPALLIAGCFDHYYWWWLGALWIAKTIVEFPFMYAVARFYGKRKLLFWFFFFQPLHIAYTVISGLFGQFGKYEWKGRRVR